MNSNLDLHGNFGSILGWAFCAGKEFVKFKILRFAKFLDFVAQNRNPCSKILNPPFLTFCPFSRWKINEPMTAQCQHDSCQQLYSRQSGHTTFLTNWPCHPEGGVMWPNCLVLRIWCWLSKWKNHSHCVIVSIKFWAEKFWPRDPPPQGWKTHTYQINNTKQHQALAVHNAMGGNFKIISLCSLRPQAFFKTKSKTNRLLNLKFVPKTWSTAHVPETHFRCIFRLPIPVALKSQLECARFKSQRKISCRKSNLYSLTLLTFNDKTKAVTILNVKISIQVLEKSSTTTPSLLFRGNKFPVSENWS